MSSQADEAAWSAEDWKWDAYSLIAAPADARISKEERAKARASDGGKQGCQVDGCSIEVGSQKDYHSRYKICEFHLKAQVVTKDGRAHRFCQQCGKFQPLEDFDGDKRSCRARLEKHNARRRRQREMAHMIKKTGAVDEKLLAKKYGLKEEELAPKLAKLAKAGYYVKSEPQSASPSGTAGGASKSHSPTVTISAPTEGGAGGPTSMHAGTAAAARAAAASAADAAQQAAALAQQLHAQQAMEAAAVLHSQRAAAAVQAAAGAFGLSLSATPMDDIVAMSCSEQQLAAAAAAAGVPNIGATGPIPIGAAGAAELSLLLDNEFLNDVFNNPMLDASLVDAALQLGAGGQAAAAAATFLQLDAAQAMDLDDMMGLEQLTNELLNPMGGMPPAAACMMGGPACTWPQPHMPQPAYPATPSGRETQLPLPYLTQAALAVQQGTFGSALVGASPFGGGLQPPPPLPGARTMGSPASQHSSATALARGISGNGSVLDEALNLLSYDSAQVTYVPEEKLVRFSAKLFNCTPAQLPSDLKASLVNMLSSQSIEGYLRPGCVHLTVNALMGAEERALLATSGVRAVVERLIARQPEAFWSEHAMLIQLGDKLALVREGRVVHVLATAHSSLFPRVAAVRPLVAEPNADGEAQVSLWGYNLENSEDTVMARCRGTYVGVERLELVADPAWNGMQRLDIRLSSLFGAGAVQLEMMRGGYISGSKAMLVTADRALVADVRALEAEEGATDVDTLLFQLAASEEWARGERQYAPEEREVLAKCSRRLLAFSVQRKWAAATRTLLASAAADKEEGEAGEAMAAVDVMCVGTTGMPLLQLAVRSQRLELVGALLQWGEAHGFAFKATTPGRRGLTALHLSGLVNDNGAIAALLSQKCPDALDGWECARAEDGSLPLDFARRTGAAAVVERLVATRRYEAAKAGSELAKKGGCGCVGAAADAICCGAACIVPESSAPEMAAAADAALVSTGAAPKAQLVRRRGAGKHNDSASSSRTPSRELADGGAEEEEEDQVAAVKAALKARLMEERAQGSLLRFRNPDLEAKYQAWYSVGQVPVDIAFLVIATLSQGAWIFRWSLDATWLGAAMVALMAVNAAMMQAAVLFPQMYTRWREPLCVWSHVAHKLAQTAVTLVAPVGTIFAASYSPTVALLESSSLAQIHMLAFGMKLRLGCHLAVGLFHFATAAAANDQVCAAGFPFIPGSACSMLMVLWQAAACFALPCALVYASERRSRRIFLETVSD